MTISKPHTMAHLGDRHLGVGPCGGLRDRTQSRRCVIPWRRRQSRHGRSINRKGISRGNSQGRTRASEVQGRRAALSLCRQQGDCAAIYFAVRDGRWQTPMPVFAKCQIERKTDSFKISLAATCKSDTVDYAWTGEISGPPTARSPSASPASRRRISDPTASASACSTAPTRSSARSSRPRR